jgi:carboxylesterase
MSARVRSGAEPFTFDGGPIGALLIHGFTGSPASMRPLGDYLHQHDVAVCAPLLAGHGTSWEQLATTTWEDWYRDAETAFAELRSRTTSVICVGLSMGAALSIHLASKHPDAIKGLVAINPYVHDPRLVGAPIGKLVMRSMKGVINDIKRPGQDEVGYDRIPTRTLPSLNRLLKTAVSDLPSLRMPLLVFSSPNDHTVKPANSKLVFDRAGSADKETVVLSNSYHVATLDEDAPMIFQRTLAFAERVATVPTT